MSVVLTSARMLQLKNVAQVCAFFQQLFRNSREIVRVKNVLESGRPSKHEVVDETSDLPRRKKLLFYYIFFLKSRSRVHCKSC